ncbi:MAG: TlpA disulfide reductase family protein [Pirellulaceae bacterium]
MAIPCLSAPRLSRVILGLMLLTLWGCSSPEAPEETAAELSRSEAADRPDSDSEDSDSEDSDSEQAAEHGKPPETAPGATAPGAADAIGVELIDRPGFDALLERNQGRVVLIDFWATWCPSCVEQFPHTVELHEEYSDSGLSVITISLDDPEKESEVLDLLREQEATTDNYISRHGASNTSMETFRIEEGLPHYQLYDRQGNLQRAFTPGQESIDLEEITTAVESLLES